MGPHIAYGREERTSLRGPAASLIFLTLALAMPLVLDVSLADIPMPSSSITSLALILLAIRIASFRCPGMAGPDKSRKREHR